MSVQLSKVKYPQIRILHYHQYYNLLILEMFLEYQAEKVE